VRPAVALVLVCAASAAARGGGASTAGLLPQRPPAEVAFRDITREAGITFAHHAAPEKKFIVESMSGGVALVDIDNDGLPDIYFVDSLTVATANDPHAARSALYRNLGHGKFEDVTDRAGVGHPGWGMGVCTADVDGDGREDLYVTAIGGNHLYRNNGDGTFTDIAEKAGVAAGGWSAGCGFADYDRDGRLDLFLGGYYPERVNLWQLADTKMMPESFEYAKNGGRKYLYRNLGQGRFEEVSAKVGLTSTRWALAAVAADLRGTGYPDLFIANDYGVSELFINEGGHFREAGRETGVGYAPKSGMNASVGDVLNQGKFAIYVSNISEEGILLQGNNLWVPTGGSGRLPTYENMARAMGIDLGGWSFGAQFGDLNNDGFLDIYLVNGYVSAARGESYWYDYSKIAGGHQLVIEDAANWPAMGHRSLAGYQPKRVWINDGSGGFSEVAQMVGASDRYDGRSVALADFSGRGALDVAVANQRGPLLLYKNGVAPDRQWIGFDLEGGCRGDSPSAPCTNRSAVGAQVELFWNGGQQLQEVSGDSGFCAQNQRTLHFGLGSRTAIDRAVIRWPSGKTQELKGLQAGRVHKIQEPA
jgi:hypothetical protein